VIGEAKVVNNVQRLQMKQELIAFVLVSEKGVPLVQGPQQVGLI
jgi:hypothetical protein